MSDVVPAGPAEPDPWGMRASDADREAYVALLKDAYLEGRLTKDEYDDRMTTAYRAATYAELAPLLQDLPVPPSRVPGPPVVPRTTRLAESGAGARPAGAPLMAIFSEVSRDSRWVLPDGQVSVAVFGSVKLDLRQVLLEQSVTELKASAVFGTVEITVPADIDVEVTGVGVLGEYKRVDTREKPAQPGGAPPRLTVSGAAVLGTVEVRVVDTPVTGADRVVGPQPPPALGS